MSASAKNVTKKSPKRPISGIFLLDKPKGITSNAAMQRVRRIFGAVKAGHTGALDPMATGLLPVCLGEATKFSHYLLDSDKSYQATVALGSQTDTGDAQGQVVTTDANVPTLASGTINAALSQFLGAQTQVPPMYSALKKEGKKLYELARAGVEVERKPRPIAITSLELLAHSADSFEFTVTCSKGTYVRVLGEDIAKTLGTLGHLTTLRRTQTGCFSLQNAHTLEALESLDDSARLATLLPSYASIAHFSRIYLDDEQAKRIKLGQRLNVHEQAQALIKNGLDLNDAPASVLIFCQSLFLGLGALEATGRLQPKRLVDIKIGA